MSPALRNCSARSRASRRYCSGSLPVRRSRSRKTAARSVREVAAFPIPSRLPPPTTIAYQLDFVASKTIPFALNLVGEHIDALLADVEHGSLLLGFVALRSAMSRLQRF